jgi:hypothetical protein
VLILCTVTDALAAHIKESFVPDLSRAVAAE